MECYHAHSISRMSEGDRFSHSLRTGACIDINQLPSRSESEDELTKEAPPFIFRLSHNTEASANPQNCTSSDLKPRPLHPEPTKVSYCEHERTLDDVSLRASESKEGALIDRKKLRLSKEKSAVLEEWFKGNSTLNPEQKIALAKQLNLRPRQVEVWFQNRRARTKLKQTEVDCEELKRCCGALSKENRRLQKEIVELKALVMGGHCVIPHGFYMPFLGTILTTGSSYKCLTPELVIAPATSTTTSISSLNQPSNIPST